MDIQEKPEYYGNAAVTFPDWNEYSHFRRLMGPNLRRDLREAFSSFYIAPIEFPYSTSISHNQLNRVLGRATMFMLIGNENYSKRAIDESFVSEISEYYSRLGAEDNLAIQANTTD